MSVVLTNIRIDNIRTDKTACWHIYALTNIPTAYWQNKTYEQIVSNCGVSDGHMNYGANEHDKSAKLPTLYGLAKHCFAVPGF